jgi:hypothetical protein
MMLTWIVLVASSTGSVHALTNDLAERVEQRLVDEAQGDIDDWAVQQGSGVDGARVNAMLVPRLRTTVHLDNAVVRSAPRLKATISASEEQGVLWVVVLLTGGTLVAPTTVVAQAFVDRELSESLGIRARKGSRFSLRRVGSIPAGALDVLMASGDAQADLLVLYPQELRRYRWSDSEVGELPMSSAPIPLPKRAWPRSEVGVLAAGPRQASEVWVATSAGHAIVIDLAARSWRDAKRAGWPLKQARNNDDDTGNANAPLLLQMRDGSPVLMGPLTTDRGSVVNVEGMPPAVRDVVRIGEQWFVVDAAGTLLRGRTGAALKPLVAQPVGDRVVAVDVDGDGAAEVITTEATAQDEADAVTVWRTRDEGSTVLLRSQLSGGSIVAMTSGVDGTRNVVVLAEQVDDRIILWRLESQGS